MWDILFKFRSEDEADTECFARALATILVVGDVVALYGPIGAGKSVVARAIVRALSGDPTLEVCSPTFVILQEYNCSEMIVSHFDLYRIFDAAELRSIDMEVGEGSGRIVLVEWPELASFVLGAKRLDVRMVTTECISGDPDIRNIEIYGDVEIWFNRVLVVMNALRKAF